MFLLHFINSASRIMCSIQFLGESASRVRDTAGTIFDHLADCHVDRAGHRYVELRALLGVFRKAIRDNRQPRAMELEMTFYYHPRRCVRCRGGICTDAVARAPGAAHHATKRLQVMCLAWGRRPTLAPEEDLRRGRLGSAKADIKRQVDTV